jgi:hypothetical protein
VHRLEAVSQFPTLEVHDETARVIREFIQEAVLHASFTYLEWGRIASMAALEVYQYSRDRDP